jgi:phosphoribosylaminoimidazole-succinocarboxamide synthase
MKEIMSLGKSVKIIRYLETKEKKKGCFEELMDFKREFGRRRDRVIGKVMMASEDEVLDRRL